MKLLLFSDVHENRRHCNNLVEMAENVDVVIGAGDFGSFRKGIKETISYLKDITKPTIVVPGNAESYEELSKACKTWTSAYVLHGSGIDLNGTHFYGLGAAVPVTPFGSWSYDITESEAEQLLKNCPEDAVLVSHSPPKGILDRSSSGQSLGSITVRNFIDQKSPKLVVCGHIHESGGQKEELNKTTIINAGPRGMYFEI